MTAPDMERIIAAVIADNSVVIHEHPDYGDMTASTLTPDELARAVLAAISEAGQVEWGVRWGDGHVATRKSKQSALNQIEYTAGSLVSRITFPWERTE